MKISINYAPKGWENEIIDFIDTLNKNLNEQLPINFQRKLEERVREIILGSTPIPPPFGSLPGGTYMYKEKKIHLAENILYKRNPFRIAGIFFHEHGHALIEDKFLNLSKELSADLFAWYSLEKCKDVPKGKEKYLQYKSELIKMLGDNENFTDKNKLIIDKTKEVWYLRIYEELKKEKGVMLPSEIELTPKLMKKFKEMVFDGLITAYNKEDNPLIKLDLLEQISDIASVSPK